MNREKTCVSHISKVKYLGYSFCNYRGKCRFRVHPKSVTKMKNKIRELTNRSNGWGNEYRALKLTQFVRGWVNYFGMADMKALLTKIDDLFGFPSYSIGNILPLVPLNVIVLYIISEQILKPSKKQMTFSNFFGIITY